VVSQAATQPTISRIRCTSCNHSMIWFQLGMLWDAGPEIRDGLGAFRPPPSHLLRKALEDRIDGSTLVDAGDTHATILGIGGERFALARLW